MMLYIRRFLRVRSISDIIYYTHEQNQLVFSLEEETGEIQIRPQGSNTQKQAMDENTRIDTGVGGCRDRIYPGSVYLYCQGFTQSRPGGET